MGTAHHQLPGVRKQNKIKQNKIEKNRGERGSYTQSIYFYMYYKALRLIDGSGDGIRCSASTYCTAVVHTVSYLQAARCSIYRASHPQWAARKAEHWRFLN